MRSLWTIIWNKLDDPEEMDKFENIYNLQRMNHEDIEYMNHPNTRQNFESVVTKNSTNEYLGWDGFILPFT